MCEFFSFVVDTEGNCYAFLGQDRQKIISQGKYPDSHTEIIEFYGLDEDECWKFDLQLNDPDRFEKFTNMTIKTAPEFLRSSYDGGLDLDAMPSDIFVKVVQWLLEKKDEILELAVEIKHLLIFQLQKIINDAINELKENSELVRKNILIKLPTAIDPRRYESFKRRTRWNGITVYISSPEGLVSYIGMSVYKHVYVNNENKVETEYRVNMQLYNVPQKIF